MFSILIFDQKLCSKTARFFTRFKILHAVGLALYNQINTISMLNRSTACTEAVNIFYFLPQDWSKEPWNGGCPVAIMSPGGLTLYGNKAMKEPLYRLVSKYQVSILAFNIS